MYVIVHKNHVIDGPKKWNFRSFEETLKEDLNITCRLPTNYTNKEAIVINENTAIMFATFINQEFNGKIQKPVDGPWWNFSTGMAIGSFTIGYKHIDEVKTELKNRLKQLRYEKEIAGTDIELNGQTFRIDTSRDARNIYLQKYLIADDTAAINWKFGDHFVIISKEDLKTVLKTIDSHIQSVFDWELSLVSAIDQCNSVLELDKIVLDDPPVTQELTLSASILAREKR